MIPIFCFPSKQHYENCLNWAEVYKDEDREEQIVCTQRERFMEIEACKKIGLEYYVYYPKTDNVINNAHDMFPRGDIKSVNSFYTEYNCDHYPSTNLLNMRDEILYWPKYYGYDK
jgi:hypothetical protein